MSSGIIRAAIRVKIGRQAAIRNTVESLTKSRIYPPNQAEESCEIKVRVKKKETFALDAILTPSFLMASL